MAVTEEKELLNEQDVAHQETLKALQETDAVLQHAQKVITEARIKLKNATQKYQERLHGPTNPRHY